MRRLGRFVVPVLIALLALPLVGACEVATASSSPFKRLVADHRFRCAARPLREPVSPEKPDEVASAIDRTEFACRFGDGTCVLWASSVGGAQEYWLVTDSERRQALVAAVGAALEWPVELVAELTNATTGGHVGAHSWRVGPAGALIVTIADSARVT